MDIYGQREWLSEPGLKVIINRGYYFPQTGAALPSATLHFTGLSQHTDCGRRDLREHSIPYPWRFGRVASLLGSGYSLPTQISATAVALNEN